MGKSVCVPVAVSSAKYESTAPWSSEPEGSHRFGRVRLQECSGLVRALRRDVIATLRADFWHRNATLRAGLGVSGKQRNFKQIGFSDITGLFS